VAGRRFQSAQLDSGPSLIGGETAGQEVPDVATSSVRHLVLLVYEKALSRLCVKTAMAKINPIRQSQPDDANAAFSALHHDPDFSLVLGGPLYQLYLRTRLASPTLELVVRRVIGICLFCWLPLLFLATIEGHLVGGVRDPFLFDPDVHIRFLAALPLLIASELLVHKRMRVVVAQFLDRGIIANEDRARFEGLIASATRLRNSVTFELALLVFVVTIGHWVWKQNISLTVSTWYAINDGAHASFTAAGYWYAFVSLTIFRFILYRWYFRLFIWYRFLWQVRALPLHFNLYHPDRSGGLGFLSASVLALSPVLVAQSISFAGVIYGRILYTGVTLPSFKIEIAIVVVFLILVAVTPLTFFAVKLDHAGRSAKREFGILASRYVVDFRRKWVTGKPAPEEPLLGTSDIQSLADLANSFSVASEIRLVPITKRALIRLALVIVSPLLPLMLTMFPLDEVLRRLFKLVV
jgi:hypothetical protein